MSVMESPLPVLVVQDGRITQVNVPAARLLGASDDDGAASLVGRRVGDLLTVLDTPGIDFSDFDPGMGETNGRWIAIQWRGPDGKLHDAALFIHDIQGSGEDADEATIEWPETFTAILTPLPRHAGRGKTETPPPPPDAADVHQQLVRLFANLAHEMRTPLNAIIGFGEILESQHFGPLSERYVEYSHDITAAGRYLFGIVNGALEIGSITGGHRLQESTIELAPTIRSATNILSAQAAEKGIEISLELKDDAFLVIADATKMMQALTNVLSNAIKYSRRISRIRIEADFQDDDTFVIRIADEGVGMSDSEIETALLPFGRADYATGQAEPGMGLGLPITKAILEAHGGTLRLESKPTVGTTANIVLPAHRIIRPEENFLSSLIK